MIFFTKKLLLIFWPSKKNGNFRWNWFFGPFLAIWPRGIFQTWPENKKRFFSHKYYFLLMMKAILVDRKTSCSTIPNLFWNILLVRSTGGDLNEGCFGPSSRSTFRFCGSRVWFTPLYSNFNLAYCEWSYIENMILVRLDLEQHGLDIYWFWCNTVIYLCPKFLKLNCS